MACRLLLSLLLPLATPSAQQTWIVDRSGAGQFLEIQPAVEAASAGDRIEVRGDSAYLGFELHKGLDIEAVGASTVEWLLVSGLPSAERARLTGLRAVGDPRPPATVVVRAENCQGIVQFERLRVDAPDDRGAIRLSLCATVLLNGCTVVGGPQTASRGSAGIGLMAGTSGVTIEDCSITGGRGRDESPPEFAAPGGAALVTSGGSFVIAQSVLQGGAGGNGVLQGGIGGTGVSTTAALVVVTGGSQVRGGPSGVPAIPGFPTGSAVFLNPFQPGRVRIGTDSTLVGAAQGAEPVAPMAALRGGGRVAPGGRTEIVLSAQSGALVVLFADAALTHLAIPGLDGPLLLPPSTALYQGTWVVSAPGSLVIPFEIPSELALRGTDVFLQGVGIETARELYFTDLGAFRIR